MEQISNIEKRLWGSADTLRANSNFASNEYFMPVMGLIFLRHAYSRYLKVRDEIIPTLPSRGGVVRDLTKEDVSRRGSIYLRPAAEFDMLVSLPEGQSAASALIAAMVSIEGDYETLKGLLPKQEYAELDDTVLRQVLRTALTVYQAQERQLAIQKKKGALVDRALAEALVFRLARQECNTWVGGVVRRRQVRTLRHSAAASVTQVGKLPPAARTHRPNIL